MSGIRSTGRTEVVDVDWLEQIRELSGGSNETPILCRDKRTGYLVVAKPFAQDAYGIYNGGKDPEEVELYRELPQHLHVINILDTITNWPLRGDSTVVMEYCNAGSLSGLRRHAQWENKLIPEFFLWQITQQVLEALQACADKGIAHGDLHTGNVFLHFPEPITDQFPHAVIADFGDQPETWNVKRAAWHDVVRYFSGLSFCLTHSLDWGNLTKRTPRYSSALQNWIELIVSPAEEEQSLTFSRVMQELFPKIPEYMQRSKGARKMPKWMVSYFVKLQQNAEQSTVRRRRSDVSTVTINSDQSDEVGASPCSSGDDIRQSPAKKMAKTVRSPARSKVIISISSEDCSLEYGAAGDIPYQTAFTGDNDRKRKWGSQTLAASNDGADPVQEDAPDLHAKVTPPPSGGDRKRRMTLTTNPQTDDFECPLGKRIPKKLEKPAATAAADMPTRPDLTADTPELVSALENFFHLGSSGAYHEFVVRFVNQGEKKINRKKLMWITREANQALQRVTVGRKTGQPHQMAGAWKSIMFHTDLVREIAKRRMMLEKDIAKGL